MKYTLKDGERHGNTADRAGQIRQGAHESPVRDVDVVNRQTGELVNALHAVTGHIPAVATGLLAGTMPTAKQREFAGLLIELGELLHHHVDDYEAGTIPGNTGPPDCDDLHSS